MPQLVLSIEGVEIRRVNLQKQRTTLGRKPHNDIVLADLVVSGEHCAFILEGLADVTVEDLRSTNGTYLNGQMVRKQKLR
ncbi:MAG TPA: FHA domain-containing protein, partial [Burkholderiaceae bacterium]|nr:FHA domain-containing protein [Burkholderiaceae bacterium]